MAYAIKLHNNNNLKIKYTDIDSSVLFFQNKTPTVITNDAIVTIAPFQSSCYPALILSLSSVGAGSVMKLITTTSSSSIRSGYPG